MTITTYDFRKKIIEPYLKGDGIEIGAGSNAHPSIPGVVHHLFDIRTTAELAVLCKVPIEKIPYTQPMKEIETVFPNGSNYLIANHVLEHMSNPIKGLIKWISYIKKDGYLVLSVPHVNNCPDKGRPPVSIEHLFLDYALNREDSSFESLEHIYPFLMAWIDLGGNAGLDKFQVAARAHFHASQKTNDIHWHAFTGDIFKKFIFLTSILVNRKMKILEFFCPENSEAIDILCTIQLDIDDPNSSYEIDEIKNQIKTIIDNINKIKC